MSWRMSARKNLRLTDREALHEYRTRERIERGEKVAGTEAEWLDRRGTAANAELRMDAEWRKMRHRF